MSDRTKFILDESQIPAQWYNIVPDLPAPPPPPLHPGTGQPVGPDDLAPLFPMELIRRRSPRAVPRHPRRGHRRLQALAADAPVPRPAAGEAAERARQDLLQVRGRLPRRFAQAEHRHAAAFFNSVEGTKRLTTENGAGQSGKSPPGVRVRAVRAQVRDLDGPSLLRPEAVPAHDDADLGRDRAPVAVAGHPVRTEGARRRPPTRPGRWGSRSAKPLRRGRSAQTRYALGSVLNHVLMHQTVIGQEALAQFALRRRGRGA